MNESNVKFISYSGNFPNLCNGILTLEINGNKVSFHEGSLFSKGDVFIDENHEEHIITGDWDIMLPDSFEKYRKEIVKCINENIPHGCCGGCL